MDTLFGKRRFSVKALTDFSNLNKSTRKHLKNVYSSLALAMLAAGAGASLYLLTMFQGLFLACVGSMVTLIGLLVTKHSKENMNMRLSMLVGFGFFTGTSMGPLLEAVIDIDPSIVPTAFIGTCVLFTCLSLSALYSEQRAYLFLGGPLLSGLLLMTFVAVFGFFVPSSLSYTIQVYLGLIVFCGLVLFDTQMIIEKHSRGDDDYIWHSVDLFIDFVEVFRRLLVILGNKEKKKE